MEGTLTAHESKLNGVCEVTHVSDVPIPEEASLKVALRVNGSATVMRMPTTTIPAMLVAVVLPLLAARNFVQGMGTPPQAAVAIRSPLEALAIKVLMTMVMAATTTVLEFSTRKAAITAVSEVIQASTAPANMIVQVAIAVAQPGEELPVAVDPMKLAVGVVVLTKA